MNRERRAVFLAILIATLLFGSAAFWNGFPLLFHDSSNYISDGFSGYFVAIRTVAYAVFVKVSSLSGNSLWNVLIAQNLVLSFLIWRMQTAVTGSRSLKLYLGACAATACVFGATWVQSQISADAMTAISVLSFCLLLLPDKLSLLQRAAVLSAFALSTLSHLSHLAILGLAFTVLFGVRRLLPSGSGFRWKQAGSALASLLILASVLNALSHGGFQPVSSYQPVLLGRLANIGALDRLMSERCPEKNYLFCLNWPKGGFSGKQLVWGADSPVRFTEGHHDNPQYAEMVWDAAKLSPFLILKATVRDPWIQLMRWKFGDRIDSYRDNSFMIKALHENFPDELESFREARQQRGELGFEIPNLLLAISLFLIPIALLSKRGSGLNSPGKQAFWIISTCVLANSAVCGAISGPLDRYGARVIWLLPSVFFLSWVGQFFDSKYKS